MERLTYKTKDGWVGVKEQEDKTVSPTSVAIHKLCKLEDVLEKYGIENAEELDKFIHHKDCQIDKWKQDYENCSKLEKSMSKEHQYCLDNWRAIEQGLTELKQNAIVPKFVIGQNIFFIDNDFQIEQGTIDVILTGQDDDIKWVKYSIDLGQEYEDDIRFVANDEEQIFATREEAEQKLAGIGGKDE